MRSLFTGEHNKDSLEISKLSIVTRIELGLITFEDANRQGLLGELANTLLEKLKNSSNMREQTIKSI